MIGTLVESRVPGPPNYGSGESVNDEDLETIILLKLENSITIVGDENSEINRNTFKHITDIQSYSNESNLSEYLNQEVIVKGKLFEAHTSHHYTEVLMEVTSIEAIF